MDGERVRDGGGGERELHLGQGADPLPHLLPRGHRLAGPVEGARDEVFDLILPLLFLPEQQIELLWPRVVISAVSTLNYYFKLKSFKH